MRRTLALVGCRAQEGQAADVGRGKDASKPGVKLSSMTHVFLLDLASAQSAPLSTVYIRLLGPFTARCAAKP